MSLSHACARAQEGDAEVAETVTNFRTKKALKEAFKQGLQIEVYQPGPFGAKLSDGAHLIEGPHYPAPHTWYARVEVLGGRIVKII